MDLISPNGKPLGPTAEMTVTVSHDQTVAVARKLIDAQIGTLLNLNVPPIQVLEMLTNFISTLLSRFDPPDARASITQGVIDGIRQDATAKARKRAIQEAVRRPAT